jgi:hypothetical protein
VELSSWETKNHLATQEFRNISWNPKFIISFTRAFHWPLSWTRWTQYIPPRPICLRCTLILSSYLRLGLPTGFITSDFPTKILYPFFFFLMVATCPAHLILPDLTILHDYIWRRVQVMKLHIMHFSPTSCHSISLRSKFYSEHTVLKHPQYMFLP